MFYQLELLLALTSLLLAARSTADGKGCQTIIQVNETTTRISSDNYASGTYLSYTWCRYVISGPPGKLINVTFRDFDLEESTSCSSDNFEIFDLHRLGPFCGNQLPVPYTSRSNLIAFEFCADYGLEGRGWDIELEYIDASPRPTKLPCEFTINLTKLDQPEKMTSPNYPNNYDDLDRCTWTIYPNPLYPVQIDAVQFGLGSTCSDKLTVTDVTNNRTHMFCGSNPLTILNLDHTSELRIEFVADEWDTDFGFWIEATLIPCKPGHQACDSLDACIPVALQCDGVIHCRDGSDELPKYCAPDCGSSHFPIHEQPRIVGGLEANRHSIPWQVAMMYNDRQFCGGTIISDRWILSAAHCFGRGAASAPNYKARVGGHDVLLSAEEDLATDMELETIINHPYNRLVNSHDYDYSLLKTKRKIVFRKNVVPACLPRQGEDPPDGVQCLTSGWGSTQGWKSADQKQNISADPLHHVTVPVVNRTACIEAYRDPERENQITDRMVCAGALGLGGIDSCQGDSGGPFVCKNRFGKYMASGIVSWGDGCARPDRPGVYAYTGYVINWIIATITTN